MAKIILSKITTYKYLLYAILFTCFLIYSFGGLIQYENNISGVEAYILFVNSKSNLFMWIFCILFSMQFPYKDIHIIMRTGKLRWFLSEIMSLMWIIIIFNFYIVINCFLFFGVFVCDDWSLDFRLCYMNYGQWQNSNLGTVGDLSGWVVFSTPAQAFIISLALNLLCGIITGLICFIFNVIERHIYGPFIVCFLYFFGGFIDRIFGVLGLKADFINFLKIYDIVLLQNIKIGFYGYYFNYIVVLTWCLILVIVLYELAVSRHKKMEVR